jgi:DNA mismatch repair ATPase MutL
MHVSQALNGHLLALDQHAADERVRFERLEETLSMIIKGDEVARSVELRHPPRLKLTERQTILAQEYKDVFSRWGFCYITSASKEHVCAKPTHRDSTYAQCWFSSISIFMRVID